jgi:hypothetical protein
MGCRHSNWRRKKLDGRRSGEDRRDEVVDEDREIETKTQRQKEI